MTIALPGFSQTEYSGEATLKGMYSTQEDLPFWMHHNQRGRFSENSNVAGWVSGKANYKINYNASLEFGGGLLYQDGILAQVFVDEVYAGFKNSWFQVIAGVKQQDEAYNGLSASNRSVLWSLNARPMPGLQLSTNSPIFFSAEKRLGFEASLNEYLLEENRHVSYARVHQKSFYFVYRPSEDYLIKAGVQHFAQWGGAASDNGGAPENMRSYLNTITGGRGFKSKSGGGNLANFPINNMGTYELSISKNLGELKAEFIYNHLFINGSGSYLANAPDGRYGIFLERKDPDRIVNSLIYEFYYTKHRSQSPKFDDYFNNAAYRSGWTYQNRVLGVPFFMEDSNGMGILKNAFVAHHIGISGQFSDYFNSFPYKLILSTVQYQGKSGIFPEQNVMYGNFEMRFLQSFVDLSFSLSAEFKTQASPNFGVGLELRKKMF